VGVTAVALAGYLAQALIATRSPRAMTWPLPGISWSGSAVALGGAVGLAVALLLLRRGVLHRSFADYDEYVREGEVLAVYPHARREMWVEIRYLAPILLGLGLGWLAGRGLPAGGPPRLLQALAIPVAGYLVGAGLVWGVRILGTLAFGREAMGMGDVHLLGAIGAVLGWFEPILIFFVAPFSGLLWALMSIGLGSVFRMLRRQLPYGPHLALATLLVILGRPGIQRLCASHLPIGCPSPGLVP
jgi:leader peptidase (prepilin peptidase)/N-methyltransferase